MRQRGQSGTAQYALALHCIRLVLTTLGQLIAPSQRMRDFHTIFNSVISFPTWHGTRLPRKNTREHLYEREKSPLKYKVNHAHFAS